MITFAVPLPAGNANKIILAPPAGALTWKLLRKGGDTFSGHDDPDALVVRAGTEKCIIDINSIANGQTYYYRAYYLIGLAWTPSATVATTSASTFAGGVDVIGLLRDRMDAGLRALVARSLLRHSKGHIPVLLAPPTFEDAAFPVVTLHLTSDASADRAIGEYIKSDQRLSDGRWEEHEGWLSRVQVAIVGWSLNPDERGMLRRAIRDVVLANLPVFDDAGMMQIDFSQQDVEDFQSYNAPLYQAMGSLTCIAAASVDSTVGQITDVTVTII